MVNYFLFLLAFPWQFSWSLFPLFHVHYRTNLYKPVQVGRHHYHIINVLFYSVHSRAKQEPLSGDLIRNSCSLLSATLLYSNLGKVWPRQSPAVLGHQSQHPLWCQFICGVMN